MTLGQVKDRFSLHQVTKLSVTIVVDNFTSTVLPNVGPATRPSVKSTNPSRFLATRESRDSLVAEHGFSAWLTAERVHNNTTISQSVLFDAGVSTDGASDNLSRLGINPKDAVAFIMSHGHFDHTTGLDGIVRSLYPKTLPIIIHPEFWNRRRIQIPGREPRELPNVSRSALIENGFDVIEESKSPSFILDNTLLVTGEIDRTTEYERGLPGQQQFSNQSWQPDPLTLDDQAIIVNVKGKGLVVITGCGHAGIVNTAKYAKKLTGVKKLHALIGGFHLPDQPHFIETVNDTIKDLQSLSPDWIVPAHCTGLAATAALLKKMPQAFVQNSVGTRYDFCSS